MGLILIIDPEAGDGSTSHIAYFPSEDTDPCINLENHENENGEATELVGMHTRVDNHLP